MRPAMPCTLLTLLALPSVAQAFCGTYVGEPGATITNNTSQVLLARYEERTTLTLVNDFGGDPSDFALVIPVPQVLSEDDVRTVIPELVEEAERYSGPRLVEYSCDDFYVDTRNESTDTGDESWTDDSASTDTGGVRVEAEFEAGEYSVVVLSAEQSTGLLTWLDSNGYGVTEQASELLQEYIDAGSYFLAAQVSAELLPPDASSLSPLQIGYDSETLSLPIRLGTVNSPGVQDLIVYALTSASEGQLHIVNYPEATLTDECMVQVDDFGDFYSDRLDQVLPTTGDAHWLLEYGWAPSGCDPCPDGGALPSWVTAEAGFGEGGNGGAEDTGSWGGGSSAYFTRLRVRYTPEQAHQDLVFSTSGIRTNTQVRYIRHDESMEDRFPLCVLETNSMTMSDDPGDCEDEWAELDGSWAKRVTEDCGCSQTDSRGALAGVLGALLLGLTRRRRA